MAASKTLYKDWVKLSWTAPTENTNGSQLKDLAGYKIYYWTKTNSKRKVVDVKNVTQYKFEKLQYGETHFFSITAYSKKRRESRLSSVILITLKKPS